MCTGSEGENGGTPRSVADALRLLGAGLDFLNSPAGDELATAALGEVLVSLGGLRAKFAAAHAAFLRRFDAAGAHDADGYGTPASWLAARTQMTRKDAKAAARQMRRLSAHPGVAGAMAAGQVSESCGLQITELARKLPEELRAQTGTILLQAAAAGASVDDLTLIAAAAWEQWRAQHPDPDDDDDGFDDRYLAAGTTFGGAAVLRGSLTPECGAAVQAVLEALGKKAGPEDHRTEGQRFHDALRVTRAGLDFLNSPAAADLDTAAIGEVLVSLGGLRARFAAAHAAFLRRFDAAGAHDADGYGTPASWLAARTQMTRKDAKAAVRQMRRLSAHPGVAGAMAAGQVSESCGLQITELTRKLPEELRAQTGTILLQAAAAGALPEDLALIAAAAWEQWRAQHPDPDDDDGGFDDRYLAVGTTFGGAAVLRGNLTPECGAAVQAVLEALGKKAGPEDHRTEGQRFHDARAPRGALPYRPRSGRGLEEVSVGLMAYLDP
ncbi:DUF222 domain-containing protein [Trebonia sp.]|uniref:DUF222 domain-containing protein n=1 Tax=Trebonia sp. TaxID=2767075 RepID=UPI0026237661|nr:DUF222 domain-containing protein [Trebonia sp.]